MQLYERHSLLLLIHEVFILSRSLHAVIPCFPRSLSFSPGPSLPSSSVCGAFNAVLQALYLRCYYPTNGGSHPTALRYVTQSCIASHSNPLDGMKLPRSMCRDIVVILSPLLRSHPHPPHCPATAREGRS